MLAPIKASNMKTDDIWFYRWGNLSPVEHKEAKDNENRDFHTAPKVWGFYAFPRGYIEIFLIGGSFTDHNRKFLLDDNGNKIDSNDFYDENNDYQIKESYRKLLKKRGIRVREISSDYDPDEKIHYVTYNLKPKMFKYTGELWHHLGEYANKDEIIETVGSWYKTSFKTYLKALHKCDVNERFRSYLGYDGVDNSNYRHGDPHTCPAYCSKDHYEVFIEKLK